MRIALQLTAPYGTVFQQVQSFQNPAQIDLYLMHDTSQAPAILSWLDALKETYQAELNRQLQMQAQLSQQPASGAPTTAGIPGNLELAEKLARQSKEAHEKMFADGLATPSATPLVVAQKNALPSFVTDKLTQTPSKAGAHDWGGLYKIGAKCIRCGIEATGFETSCKPA